MPVCKPESHTTLYQALDSKLATDSQSLTIRQWNGTHREVWTYRVCNQLPLRLGDDALLVNWFELHIRHADTGQTIYHNAWITDLPIQDQNVVELADCGRARWKVENEGNNVLKTKGYHLEHNFGHGNQFLAMTLLTLNLMAFLLHTLSHLANTTYRRIREALGRRDTFFNDLRALTRYLIFDSWSHLLQFMFMQLELKPAPD